MNGIFVDEENIPDEPTVEDIEEDSDDNNDDDDEDREETIEDSKTKISADITGGPKDPFTARYELKISDELMEAVKNRDMQTQMLKWKRYYACQFTSIYSFKFGNSLTI